MAKFFFKKYNLNGILINEIIHFIDLFWLDVVNKLHDQDKIRVVIICNYNDDDHLALSKFLLVDKSSKESYIKHILSILNNKNDYYSNSDVSTITFKYVIIKDLKFEINESFYDRFSPNKASNKMKNIKGFNFPSDMLYEEWGDLIFKTENTLIIHYNNTEIINVSLKFNEVILMNNSSTILSFKDTRLADNYFIRTIDNYTYHYIDDQLVIINELSKKFKNITRSYPDKIINNNFLTLDIETRVIDNNITPYCICYYDGDLKQAFYLTDYDSVNDMVKECLKSLLVPKFNKKLVYIHNLSLFDGVFLLGPLSELVHESDIQILKREDKIILIKVKFDDYYIEFRDSLLMLPLTLKKLAKTFNKDDQQKDIFPYSFVDSHDLNYVGNIPDFKYFNNISIEEYNDYCAKYNNNWSLKDESIKYCVQDCVSLYNVIFNFNKIYFNKFKMNIHKYPTLSSLSMATFRTCFLNTKKTKISVINGSIYKEIKAGYTGGATDLYIPEGENVSVYDVNSLYPTVMADSLMPVGKPKKFEGDISLIDKNAFGFFQVEVTAPEFLDHPILQTRIQSEGSWKTVSPLGKWTDMIFSEEMYNAMKYGYNFKILRGYLFEKQVIFKDFINTLYEIKASVHKSDPMYLITKLIQNSNYGRWGLNYELADHCIVNDERFQALNRNIHIDLSNPIELSKDRKLVGITDHLKYIDIDNDDTKFNFKISLPIAAAITAYARIFMSQFKNNPNYILLYTDTDSAMIIGRLPDHLVGNKLGQFKLEYNLKKLIILAPKVYAGILEDGSEIIKVKGLKAESIKKHLNFQVLETLLHKDSSLQIPNTKFIRSFQNKNINLRNDLYTLMVTDNKRKLIYRDNKLVGTTPLIINSNKEIIN